MVASQPAQISTWFSLFSGDKYTHRRFSSSAACDLACAGSTAQNAKSGAMPVIEADGAKLHGWITSQLDPDYACLNETMVTLQTRINAPFLGKLAYMESCDVEIAAGQLRI